MKKKTTTRKTTTKARPVAKARVVASKKSTASRAKRSTAAVKATKRKGITHHVKHHAKRIYRLTPKFVHGMIAGGFVGVVLVTSLGYTSGASAANPTADPCIKV